MPRDFDRPRGRPVKEVYEEPTRRKRPVAQSRLRAGAIVKIKDFAAYRKIATSQDDIDMYTKLINDLCKEFNIDINSIKT